MSDVQLGLVYLAAVIVKAAAVSAVVLVIASVNLSGDEESQ